MYMSILSRLNEAQKFSSAYFVFMLLLLHIRSFVSEYTSLRPSLYICFAVYAFLVLLFLFSHIPHPLLVCSGGSYCTALENGARHFIQFLCLLSGTSSFALPFSMPTVQYTPLLFVLSCERRKKVSLRQFKMQVSGPG